MSTWNASTSYGGGYDGNNTGTFSASQRRLDARQLRKEFIVAITCNLVDEKPLTHDGLRLGSVGFSKVVLCGMVSSVYNDWNYMAFDLDDSTGTPIEVRQYYTEKEPGRNAAQCTLNGVIESMFVKVYGHLRMCDGRVVLSAFHVAPLKNLNELTMHILESTYAKLYYTKDVLSMRLEAANFCGRVSPLRGFDQACGLRDVFTDPAGPFSLYATSKTLQDDHAEDATMVSLRAGKPYTGLTGIKDTIMCTIILAQDKNDEGINFNDLHRIYCPSISTPNLRKILAELLNDGHLYTTIDDNHFKSTVDVKN